MAKSIRSKLKKRFRTLKREHYSTTVGNEKLKQLSDRLLGLQAVQNNHKKNAFLYPDDPDSAFPQYEKQELVDFRSSHVETSGYQFKGSQRSARSKKKEEEAIVEVFNDDDMGADNQDEEEVIDLDDDDLGFSKMAINASKKIKKKKGEAMVEEKVRTVEKKMQKKDARRAKGGANKSKKIMKW